MAKFTDSHKIIDAEELQNARMEVARRDYAAVRRHQLARQSDIIECQ